MKKQVFLFPLIALLLSGCSIEDLMFWKKNNEPEQQDNNNDQNPGQKDSDEQKDDEETPPTTIKVSSITLSKSETSIEELQKEELSYTIEPSNASNKNVEWSTSNGNIASVIDGTIHAINPGTATITVTTEDGNKTDSCEVTVTKKESDINIITSTYTFSDHTSDTITNELAIDENITFQFAKGDGVTTPAKYGAGKKYHARLYPKNTLTIKSSDPDITKVELVFSEEDDGVNPITASPGTYVEPNWTGSSKEIVFTNSSDVMDGHRKILAISVSYEGEEPAEDELINLGEKTITEVKEYIAEHPVPKNDWNNGVNEKRVVTIKGFALAKIDLVKTLSSYGLDVSYPGKIIMADSTDSIAVASKVDKQGTSLWGKIGDYACKETSKYIVTGYISEYLGHPEIEVDSFTWDQTLDISWNPTVISKATTDLEGFYTKAKAVNYNCAGHGYGDVITANNLKCYYIESDGSGTRYYNFTDGSKNIRINAYNLGPVSVDSIYDVTGIISLKNLSPIIIAFKITATTEPASVDLDYVNVAQNTTIQNLKVIHGSQADTTARYDNVVGAYGTFFKTTGYLCAVNENGKYYIGISDNYYNEVLTGKDNAMSAYNVSLFKNDNFWNTTLEELYLFNPLFDEYVLENKQITVYYVVRQQRFKTNKPMWEILLLPQFIEDLAE